ncbi:hypothetical protein AB0D99_10590 [Streptomyces sp. NPDC047971]|uniref:hypothetical protein n=1 Tax=Streptomyces sp. NPDC047971 TaxID=3154499 RepID=UPI00340120FE
MRRLTAAAIAATAALLALTGCSSQTSDNSPPTAPTTTAPALSAAEQREACVDAWAATIGARPADFNPETDTDPTPDACTSLSESDSLDAYMDGLQQTNKAGQDAFKKAIEDAASAATPSP